MRAGLLVLAVVVTGCGYAKRSDVDAELARVRQELQAADQAQAAQLNARIEQNAQRLAALERALEQLRTDFGARIERLQGDFEGLVAFDVPVHFDFAKSDVRPADRPVLDRFAAVVQQYYPGALITVEGFTDPSGSTAYNLRLGKARADAVRDYLVGRGLSADLVRSVSYGESRNRQVVTGAAANRTGAAANRRVALVVDALAADRAVAQGR